MAKYQPCMIDNDGKPVSEWLPHMQSNEFLKHAIVSDMRTAECWEELKRRRQRVHAGMRAVHGPDWTPKPV